MTYPLKDVPGSSHRWALEQVASLPGDALRVLDVGAAEGHVTRLVRRARPRAEVWAIEPDPAAAGKLAEVADLVSPWLEQVPREEGFDLALLLDVLEHVTDPATLLAEAVARVRPGGTLLLSVPNVAHWSTRGALLAGEFPYTHRGILDRTHVHFFTRRSLRALVARAGLVVEGEAGSIVPVELALPEALAGAAPAWAFLRGPRRALARALPGLCAYQLLVRARKP